jgi:hypothetical protein
MPKVDNTDVYAFRSYAPGRQDFVTLISNFQPFQEPGGGPNYFTMDPDAIYEIHIDNDGNAAEDITFQFRFFNTLRNNTGITVNVGGVNQPIALRHIGQVTQPDDPELGEEENYSVTMITGDRRTGRARRSPSPTAPSRPSASRSTMSATRRSPTTTAMPASSFTPSPFRVAPSRAESSSASAPRRSPSTSGRSSIW